MAGYDQKSGIADESQAKLGEKRPSQARPIHWPKLAFGLA